MRGTEGPSLLAAFVSGCAVLAAVLMPVAALLAVVRLIVWLVAG